MGRACETSQAGRKPLATLMKQGPQSPQSTSSTLQIRICSSGRLCSKEQTNPCQKGLSSTSCPLGCFSPRLLASDFAFLWDNSTSCHWPFVQARTLPYFCLGSFSVDLSDLRILWLSDGSSPSLLPHPVLSQHPAGCSSPGSGLYKVSGQICSSALNTSAFGLFGSLIKNHMIF